MFMDILYDRRTTEREAFSLMAAYKKKKKEVTKKGQTDTHTHT